MKKSCQSINFCVAPKETIAVRRYYSRLKNEFNIGILKVQVCVNKIYAKNYLSSV